MSGMTIYDIAKEAGVSIATVSRVLNQPDRVSEKSRLKVQQVINEHGYVPNAMARGLSIRRSGIVGILCPIISDVNHAQIVSALEKHLVRMGFHSLISCTNHVGRRRDEYLRILAAKQVDGIIVVGSDAKATDAPEAFREIAQNVPIVVVNGLIQAPGVYSIYADEYRALYDMTTELLRKGYEELLYLNDTDTFSGRQKLQGFLDAYREHGHPERKTHLRIQSAEDAVRAAYDAVDHVIRKGAPFQAILSADDVLAIGALKALADHSMHMPVVGYNNTRFAQCCTPELSSIDSHFDSLCEKACAILAGALHNETPPSVTKVPASFIQRDSYIR